MCSLAASRNLALVLTGRAQIDADLAQRRFMLVDPSNRLVADMLESEWNGKLRTLAKTREDRERGRREDEHLLGDTVRERLIAMTADFNRLWTAPGTPNRERKRMLDHIIEDATLVKLPAEGTTQVHVRFKGGHTETITTLNPKSSAQQVKTSPKIVELVDKLLDQHTCCEIADLLNEQGIRPGGAARPGCDHARFTALRVAYLAHRYNLRSRYDRLRDQGMLTKAELAAQLNIHETTLVRWVAHGLILRHAYNAHAYLYEEPTAPLPIKHCRRWDRLDNRKKATNKATESMSIPASRRGAV